LPHSFQRQISLTLSNELIQVSSLALSTIKPMLWTVVGVMFSIASVSAFGILSKDVLIRSRPTRNLARARDLPKVSRPSVAKDDDFRNFLDGLISNKPAEENVDDSIKEGKVDFCYLVPKFFRMHCYNQKVPIADDKIVLENSQQTVPINLNVVRQQASQIRSILGMSSYKVCFLLTTSC
jgi:hypothetical protein